jgi:hypothetical protein
MRKYVFGIFLLFALGFILWAPMALQVSVLREAGYYAALLTVALLIGTFRSIDWSCLRGMCHRSSGIWWALGLLALAVWLLFVHVDFGYKFAPAEYLNAAVAESLHAERDVEVLSGGRPFGDRYFRILSESSHEAYLYPFLVSLMHDLLGECESNMFLVNGLLAVVSLAVGFRMGLLLGGRCCAALSLLLWCSLPVFAQSATGAGLAMTGLVCLQLVILLSWLYLRAPSAVRESRLVLATVLLFYAQFEALVLMLPVLAVLCVGWYQARRCFCSWGVAVAPLLCVLPCVGARLARAGEWSVESLTSNFPYILYFFFNTSHDLTNSLVLAVLGGLSVLALCILCRRAGGSLLAEPSVLLAMCFLFGAFGYLVLVAGSEGGRLDVPALSAMALPLYAVLVLVVLVVAARFLRTQLQWTVLFGAVGVYILGFTLPVNAKGVYSEEHNAAREQIWLAQVAQEQLMPSSMIIDEFRISWVLGHWPAVTPEYARGRMADWKQNPPFHRYPEMYVVERLQVVSVAKGEVSFVSDVVLPGVSLEFVAERSFQPFRLTRVSRVVWAE